MCCGGNERKVWLTDDVISRGINEGRMAAREVDLYLMHCTGLPVTGGIVKRTANEIFSYATGQ